MNQRVMHLQNLYDFSLVRFQPSSIILLDKNSRRPYEFYQSNCLQNIYPEISHPYLLRPILYKNGIMYAKGCESLASLLEFRRRDYQPSRYSIEQIINTFQPIFECLDFVHQKGIAYGNLSSEHISFFENGQILLKDWLFKRSENQASHKVSKVKDMKDIGLILAQAATLIPAQQISKLSTPQIVSMVLEFYSHNFCAALIILIDGMQKHYGSVLGLINSDSPDLKISEIKIILDQAVEIKASRDKQKSKVNQRQQVKQKLLKQVQNQKRVISTPRKQNKQKQQLKYQVAINQNGSIQGSPTKKFNITTPSKKIIRLEDCENKKVFNQEVKKRQIQKITKIIERSNAFVNQLMARKNNDKKLLNTVKVNASLFETQQNSKKTPLIKQSPKISSPTKRMRSISKKK